ncbi:Dyp-type peroxidase [Nocardia sp. NPDC056064]|uniref:Dyp-type peroxidase n=1 Tax=Nocardia sp. NPDC056064 TaxID=3345701 RepID=UPI0035D65EFC
MADPKPGLSRRRLLGGGAAAVGVVGAAGIGWGAAGLPRAEPERDPAADVVEFYGPHQAGIATPPPGHVTFAGFDLAPEVTRDDIIGLLRIWTDDAHRLTRGGPALADTEPELAARPARLTITVGFGPGLFTAAGVEDRRPPWLRPLPAFPIDRLDPAYTGADLVLQICADEATTVAHATRVLSKHVRSLVRTRWVQRGFRDAPPGQTPRNLMGQLDGTVGIAPADFDRLIWDDGATTPWLSGGTSLVLRRIAMDLDTWDELDADGRELTVGRRVSDGAPLTGTAEHDEPDLTAVDRNGIPVIPPGSHVARARHTHAGERFLRRGFNYDEPPAPGQVSNSGLLFVAYQRDIDTQFLPVQRRLAEFDALNEWTTPIGSAVFAIPAGVPGPGHYLGQQLFDS